MAPPSIWNCFLLVELHLEGSAPEAWAAGLFIPQSLGFLLLFSQQSFQVHRAKRGSRYLLLYMCFECNGGRDDGPWTHPDIVRGRLQALAWCSLRAKSSRVGRSASPTRRSCAVSSDNELSVSLTRRVCLGGAQRGPQLEQWLCGGRDKAQVGNIGYTWGCCMRAGSSGLWGQLPAEPVVASMR